MPLVNNIHDELFRATMGHREVAADFLRQYLPSDIVRHIRLETLAICKDTFVTPDQARHHSDRLYEVLLSEYICRPGSKAFDPGRPQVGAQARAGRVVAQGAHRRAQLLPGFRDIATASPVFPCKPGL